MKLPDVFSTFIAGIFGALFLVILGYFFLDEDESIPMLAVIGLTIGASVQIAVRLTGIS